MLRNRLWRWNMYALKIPDADCLGSCPRTEENREWWKSNKILSRSLSSNSLDAKIMSQTIRNYQRLSKNLWRLVYNLNHVEGSVRPRIVLPVELRRNILYDFYDSNQNGTHQGRDRWAVRTGWCWLDVDRPRFFSIRVSSGSWTIQSLSLRR